MPLCCSRIQVQVRPPPLCACSRRPAVEFFPRPERRPFRRDHDDTAVADRVGQHTFDLEFDPRCVAWKYPGAFFQRRPDIIVVTGVHRSHAGLDDRGRTIVDSPPNAAAGAWGDHRARPFWRDRQVAAAGVERRGTRAQRAPIGNSGVGTCLRLGSRGARRPIGNNR